MSYNTPKGRSFVSRPSTGGSRRPARPDFSQGNISEPYTEDSRSSSGPSRSYTSPSSGGSYPSRSDRSYSSSSGPSRFGDSRGGRPSFSSRSVGGFSRGSRGDSGGGSRGGRKMTEWRDHSVFVNTAKPQLAESYTNIHTFKDFGFVDALDLAVEKAGYTLPSPIQDQAIREVMSGRDVIGIAGTGTGKTAAFLLPLIHRLLSARLEGKSDLRTLIVVPTRELAIQIEDELFKFTQFQKIFSAIVVGGIPIYKQLNRLSKLNQFVIGTPGRLNDLVDRKAIDLKSFDVLVLDEVDRMLDMGFVDEMKELVARMKPERQTLFFSATTDKKVEILMQTFLKDPAIIKVKRSENNDHIEQSIIRASGRDDKMFKLIQLVRELQAKGNFKGLVFAQTKAEVDRIDKALYQEGFKVAAIHGDKSQSQRSKSLDKFKTDYVNMLAATDVAARGLDIPHVSHVINYDTPENYDTYVHRIGRTGRAGKGGNAITFVN